MGIYGPAEVTNDAPTSSSWGMVVRPVGTGVPSGASGDAVAPVVTAIAASSKVLKSSAGNVYGITATSDSVSGYVMLFDAASAPSNGTVTPKRVWALAQYSTLDREFAPPLRMAVGATLAFSSTGPFTLTLSATAFLGGETV